VHAVGVFDHELAAVVLVRAGEEERGGQVGPDPVRRARYVANGVVHVIAERMPALVAVEERREHAGRERRGDEERTALKRRDDLIAELLRLGGVLGQLQVVLGACGLMTGCHAAVDPRSRLEAPARVRDFVRREHVGNL
jgi:hypothetical protein